jgi:hypothetical protein
MFSESLPPDQSPAFSEEDLAISNGIINHLGGVRALKLMVAAYYFSYDRKQRTLKFRFRGSEVANCVEITLNANDLYDLKFWKIRGGRRGLRCEVVQEFEDYYSDSLMPIFEETTGLDLTVPIVRAAPHS